MQTATAISEALRKYLDLASDQMKLTAANMANVDTPGYQTQGFDFEAEFSRALRANGLQDTDPQVIDGNNVSLDREAMQLAKAQLQFRTGVALLKSEYSRVMSAIHAEAK